MPTLFQTDSHVRAYLIRLFQRNPYAYIGCHVSIFFLAIIFILWAFHLGPSPFFCASSNPCTCQGGGYEIYYKYCDTFKTHSALDPILNATESDTIKQELLLMKMNAQNSFKGNSLLGDKSVIGRTTITYYLSWHL